MKILLLGANGFIGSSILMRLMSAGHEVTGLARNPDRAALKWPAARWLRRDLATMKGSADWQGLYRVWFACGFPAFLAVIGILWLMLMKPDIAF